MEAILLEEGKEENKYAVTVGAEDIIEYLLEDGGWLEWYVKAHSVDSSLIKDIYDCIITSIKAHAAVEENKIVLRFSLPEFHIKKKQLKQMFDYYIEEVQYDYELVDNSVKYDLDNLQATFVGIQDHD